MLSRRRHPAQAAGKRWCHPLNRNRRDRPECLRWHARAGYGADWRVADSRDGTHAPGGSGRVCLRSARRGDSPAGSCDAHARRGRALGRVVWRLRTRWNGLLAESKAANKARQKLTEEMAGYHASSLLLELPHAAGLRIVRGELFPTRTPIYSKLSRASTPGCLRPERPACCWPATTQEEPKKRVVSGGEWLI